jgi:CRP-like cAMP-binding protein
MLRLLNEGLSMDALRRAPKPQFSPLHSKLNGFARLSADEAELLLEPPSDRRIHGARDPILEGGSRQVRLVSSGWVGAVRVLADGRRQILQVAIPGDIVQSPLLADGHVVALTAARTTDAAPLLRRALSDEGEPSNLRIAWRLSRDEDQRNLLAQIVRLGSLSAYERTANLIHEVLIRHRRAGLGDGRRITWPITQEVLADIVGLSIVHVNRVLQQLRRDGLIELRAGYLAVQDVERLASAGFAPAAAAANDAAGGLSA